MAWSMHCSYGIGIEREFNCRLLLQSIGHILLSYTVAAAKDAQHMKEKHSETNQITKKSSA